MLEPETLANAAETPHKVVSITLEKVEGNIFTVTNKNSGAAKPGYENAKRWLDLSLSVGALVVFALPMLIIALAVKFSSSGSILFKQERLGRDCQPFTIYKFRTMFNNTPTELHRQYIQQLMQNQAGDAAWLPKAKDPRVTPIGFWLRRTGLDELPQLFNVIKGEMSLVGPRPPLAYEVELYQSWQLERLSVLPGITGLWQVAGRGTASFDDMVKQDLEYIQQRNLLLDLWIIVMTIPRRLLGSLRYQR